MFTIIYYFFSLLIYIISIPILLILSFKKKYNNSILARFFLINNPPFEKELFHFHTCSLGETKSIKPIVDNLNEEINISVITETGFKEAEKISSNVRYLPFEIFIPFWFKKCKKLIVLEAELWYMLFFIGKRKCEKTILLNARISKKSYPKYKKFKWFYKKIFQNIDLVLAQSEEDKERLKSIGAKNIEVIGNIKTVGEFRVNKNYEKNKKLITLASTHKNEEELLLKNIDLNNYQIAIAPRHPERFKEVEEILKKFNLEYEKLSSIKDNKLKKNIILIDKIGELINFYAISDIVILGGSFIDNIGGHNPIEVAYFNKPLITGKYIFNQKALFNEIENAYIIDIEELRNLIKNNLQNSKIKQKASIKKIIKYIKE